MPSNVTQYSTFTDFVSLGITQVFEDDQRQHKRTYTDWLKEETVERKIDTDSSISGLGAMQTKEIGGAISIDAMLKGANKAYDLTPYALGVILEYELLRWEKHGVFEDLGSKLSRSVINQYNTVAYSVLNNSFSAPSSVYKTFQLENLMSSTHTRIDGGTWSNQSSSNPGLSYLGIQQGLINLRRLVGERGFYEIYEASMLVCAPEQEFIAQEILGSDYRPDIAAFNKNTLKNAVKVHSSPFITSTTAWWLLSDPSQVKIKMRLGDKPTSRKSNDPRTLNMLYTIYCSFGLGIYDSRGWFGSNPS